MEKGWIERRLLVKEVEKFNQIFETLRKNKPARLIAQDSTAAARISKTGGKLTKEQKSAPGLDSDRKSDLRDTALLFSLFTISAF